MMLLITLQQQVAALNTIYFVPHFYGYHNPFAPN
jgi:hypothetical protein